MPKNTPLSELRKVILISIKRYFHTMLAKFEEVKKILICPRSGCSLVQEDEFFMPLNDEQAGKPRKIRYSSVGRQPVLVDFDNSVLDENEMFMRDGSSVLQRRQGRFRNWIKGRLLHPDANRLAGRLAVGFAQKLKAKVKRPRLLMIGAGIKGIGTDVFYDDPDIQVIGFDIYASPLTHFIADAHRIPIETGSVDGVCTVCLGTCFGTVEGGRRNQACFK